jgi:phage terminase large subunit GpA-like protein
MIRDTPILKERISDSKERSSESTILKKKFSGGFLALVGSNSPASISSRPIRILLCDEVDRYVPTKEGDAIKLGRARGTTFYNFKQVLVSSPSLKGESRIASAFEDGDQRYYFVPCPHCGQEQHLKFDNLEWDKKEGEDLPHTAFYVCEHCGQKIRHAQKAKMIRAGRWIPQAKSKNTKTISFCINALYSSFKTWAEIVEDFLDSADDIQKYRVFVNTVLGQEFEQERSVESVEIVRDERVELYDPEYEVPEGAYILTAGVDVQANRLECEVVAWGPGKESWSVTYQVIWGSPTLQETWDELDNFLRRNFTHRHGTMNILKCLVDSGYATNDVYNFTKDKARRGIFASKGVGGPVKHTIPRPTRTNKQRALLYNLGVDEFKEKFYKWLSFQTPGPGYCHFPDKEEYDQEYFDQLTAEEPVQKLVKGREIRGWVKTRKRNEALDCRILNFAAVELLNPIFDDLKKERQEKMQAQEAEKKQAEEKVKTQISAQRKKFRRGFINNY